MVVLIIGSKGFIGKKLHQYFLIKGFQVIGCDVVSKGMDESNYFFLDILKPNYDIIFETHKISVCINCSGSANVQLSFIEPLNDFISNTLNVFKILESIRNYSPDTKFINLSSAAVYGNPNILPIREDTKLSPVSPYGIHKLQSEQICREFYDFYNLKICSLRIFSAYGIGLKKQLFWDLFKKLDGNQPIILFGTGRETRDFINIDDILLLINLIIDKDCFNGEVYNVASGKSYSVEEIAKLFYSYFDKRIVFSFQDKQKVGDPLYWQADISKIVKLGFKTSVTIEEGINKYVEWLKNLK